MFTKIMSAAFVVVLVACNSACHHEPVNPPTEWETVPCSLFLHGENSYGTNEISGALLAQLAQNMETGKYFSTSVMTIIQGTWKRANTPYSEATITWSEVLGEITPTCGVNDDSVIFTTTEKYLGLAPEDSAYLDTAYLKKGYVVGNNPLNIAGNDDKTTMTPTQSMVSIIWSMNCDIVPQASHCEVTDTLAYTLIFGIAYNTCVAIDNIEFCWANGDTNVVGTTHRQEYSYDFSWAYNFISGTDTARTDTCKQINLLRADGKIVAWDTLDRYCNNATPSYEFQIVLFKNPGGP